MLGLGSGIIKVASKLENLGIVTEGLVLKHNYAVGAVQPIGSGAAYFDGNDDYIATNAKPVDTADATYCWWSNSTQANSQPIFTHGGTNIGGFHANYSGTGKPLLYLSGSIFQYWVDTNFADDGKWHHWSLVVDVSSMDDCKLYCDGIEVARSNGNTNGSITSYSNIEIGRAVNNSYLAGYICNFGVWSSHLSQAQIKSIMQKDYAGLSDSEKTDLVSWWNLDSVVEDTTTLVYDNHHGGTETYGIEEVTNGDFATDSDWTKGTGWTVSGGNANSDGSGTSFLYQTISNVQTKSFLIEYEVKNYVSGSVSVVLGSAGSDQLTSNSNGVVSDTVVWDGTSDRLNFKSVSLNGSIDNISVKEVSTFTVGETLGDEMVVNGDFSNGTTNWTKASKPTATQEIVNGALKMYSGDASDNSNQMSKSSGYSMIGGVSGKTYRLRITASDFTAGGTGKIRLDGVYLAGSAGAINFTAGTQDVYFTAYRNFTSILFISASHSHYYTIDDVSLKLVNGNTGTLS